MLQNYQPWRNNRSFRPWGRFERPEKAKDGGERREFATVRLSSGISANILDFGLPQKHVLRTCRRGARPQGRLLKDRHHQQRRGAGATTASIPERAHGSFVRYPEIGPAGPQRQAGARNRAGSDSGKQGNEFE